MPEQLQSFKDFHKIVPLIIRKVNRDENLALLAMVNPIIAIEEMGFKLSPKVREEVELRIRFSVEEINELKNLEKEIQQIAGKKIDLHSNESIEKLVFKDLKIKKPESLKSLVLPDPILKEVDFTTNTRLSFKDPLDQIRSKHPILKSLKRFRSLLMSKPGFADKLMYEKIKSGKIKLPIKSIKIVIPEDNHLREEVNHA